MSVVAATVAAVLYSLATPTAEPVVEAAFFNETGAAICEKAAERLNENADGGRFYCE